MGFRRGKEGEEMDRWLEVDASMTGTLAFKDPVNLRINGRFEGALDTKGNLAIGEKAQVKATIRGEAIVIKGTVNGTVVATGRVELLPGARVTGKLSSPRVVIQDGALFHGTLEMLGNAEPVWMTVEELARYLEVEPATVIQWAQAGRLPGQRQPDGWKFERQRIEEWLAQEKITR